MFSKFTGPANPIQARLISSLTLPTPQTLRTKFISGPETGDNSHCST